MFSGHTNTKLCLPVNAIVVNLGKITKPRKRQLKVIIVHNFKEILKRNSILICFLKQVNLKFVSFSKNILMNNLAL